MVPISLLGWHFSRSTPKYIVPVIKDIFLGLLFKCLCPAEILRVFMWHFYASCTGTSLVADFPLFTALAFLGIRSACDLIYLLDWNVSLLGGHWHFLFLHGGDNIFMLLFHFLTISSLWDSMTSWNFIHLLIGWLIDSLCYRSFMWKEGPTKYRIWSQHIPMGVGPLIGF